MDSKDKRYLTVQKQMGTEVVYHFDTCSCVQVYTEDVGTFQTQQGQPETPGQLRNSSVYLNIISKVDNDDAPDTKGVEKNTQQNLGDSISDFYQPF